MLSRSRHKSCLACIQTKRKCDRTWPKCNRCVARGSECQYIGRNHRPLQSNHRGPFHVSRPANEELSGDWQLQQYDIESTMPISCLDEPVFQFPNHPFNFGSVPHAVSPVFDSIDLNSSTSEPVFLDLDGTQAILADKPLQARVEFGAKRLAMIPRTFVEQGQTMFIHRMLFQWTNSSVLQNAMSACALYCMKTATTQALIFQNMEQNCQRLIASTNAQSASQLDLLAALQALILYQIMRLFDGDIRLRARAEGDLRIMLLWTVQLRTSMYNAAQMTLVPGAASDSNISGINYTSNWQSWLVQESIRRTVITAFMLNGVYRFLALAHDCPAEVGVFYTAQTALWDAQSDRAWRRALEEKDTLETRITNWEEFMAKTKATDLEELGVLILAMMWGLEATQTWLGPDASEKYGLETG